MNGIDYKKELNDEQHAAVMAPDGPVLVLAAAGTGKTRTLVYRVAHLVERGISPDRILLLTFTNRAAHEMLDRAQAIIGGSVGGIWGGTFHHLANRILRRHAKAIGYNNDYTILDKEDAKQIVNGAVKNLKLQDKKFPKSDVLLGIFGTSANIEVPVDKLITDRYMAYEEYMDHILKIHSVYEARKREMQAMDFDDLLLNCLKLFRKDDEIVRHYQEKFLHVLVDEYQDTNPIQSEMIDRLSKANKNVFVVGDDFQSIYSWRGADYRNIMSFPDRFAGTSIFKLETNYRSAPEILNVANKCIAGNPAQFKKVLKPTKPSREKPAVVVVRDGEQQARYIIETMMNFRRKGIKLSEIAVLYRAHYHAMELQMELTRSRVSYVITSGVRFFEQAHIKDVCALLRMMEHHNDEIAFVRVLSFLPSVGERTAQKIWAKAGGKFIATDKAYLDLLEKSLPAAAVPAWKAIRPIMEVYTEESLNEDGGEVIFRFMKAFYEKHLVEVFQDHERRADDIKEVILYTTKFESVEGFLSDIALLTNLDAESEELEQSAADSLKLSTVHQAKGLEWKVVILLWVTDGMFPSSRSMTEAADGEAEERRLFYVAVTRAKEDLVMCVPEIRRNRDGGVIYCEQSRFINELPLELVRKINPGFI